MRYHGTPAPGSKLRARIVTAGAATPVRRAQAGGGPGGGVEDEALMDPTASRRLCWAELMKRVCSAPSRGGRDRARPHCRRQLSCRGRRVPIRCETDVLECPRCSGRMRVMATIKEPEVIRSILECIGLPAPLAPAPP